MEPFVADTSGSQMRQICCTGHVFHRKIGGSPLLRTSARRCSRCTVLREQFEPSHSLRRRSPCITRTAASASEDRSTYRLVEVTLRKPMGLVLADSKDRTCVIVEEVVPGGNAEKSGQVQVGDILTKCSATVLKDGAEGQYEKEGYGQRPYLNWKQVMFDCQGQDFDTVMKAIGSNTERWGIFNITLELKRYIGNNTSL